VVVSEKHLIVKYSRYLSFKVIQGQGRSQEFGRGAKVGVWGGDGSPPAASRGKAPVETHAEYSTEENT